MAEDPGSGAGDEPEVEETFLDPARRSERGKLHQELPEGDAPSDTFPMIQPGSGRGAIGVPPSESGRVPPHDTLPAGAPIESTLRSVAPPADAVQTLGPYELRRVLGKGGMGVVYEAYHPQEGVSRALKVISSPDVDREELARFDREARAVQKLSHPHIVSIHDVGLDSGRPYFTMDLVEGTTLQSLARGDTTLTPRRSAELVATVATAIHYAHEQGIIHRDLKPANILIDQAGEPHVTDFGLAKDLGEASMGNLTLTGVAMGSPPYMPPEQARGLFRQVDAVSDVYGLGALLYECLTGRPPFKGKSLYDVIAQVLTQEPTAPSKLREGVPPPLETICLKALEKEKWRRYPSAQAMERDLQRYLRGEAVRAVRGGLTTRIGRRVAQHRHVVAALLPLFVIAALLTYAFGPRRMVLPPDDRGASEASEPGPLLAAAYAVQSREPGFVPLVDAVGPLPARNWRALFPSADELDRSTSVQLDNELPTSEDPLPPEQLVRVLRLVASDAILSPSRFAEVITELIEPSHAEFVQPLRSTLLAFQGVVRRDPAPFELALAEVRQRPSPLDRAVLVCARQTLSEPEWLALRGKVSRSLASSAEAYRAPVRRPSGFVQARPISADLQSWRWPPASQRSLCTAWRGTTHPLLSADGRWVYVGWLRFVYTLASDDGRVAARTRLPGVATSLRYAMGGGLEAEVEAPTGSQQVALRISNGPEVRVARPFAPSLTPEPETVPVDELRWLARARFPSCDPGIEVAPRAGSGVWHFYPYVPLEGGARCGIADLGVQGPEGRRLVLGDILVVPPKSFARKSLRSEERLVRISPPLPGIRPAALLRLENGRVVPVRPAFRPLQPDDPNLDPLLDDAALLDESNPWVLAFAAALRSELDGPPVGKLAERALESPLLTGSERVSLIHYLSSHGLDRIEAGMGLALRDLDAAGWVAGWSGTGPLDPWHAASHEADVERELTSLGARGEGAPGGMSALGLVLAEAGFAFQQSLIPGSLGLLLLLWLRYRRQTRRDLARSGVRGRLARLRLWIVNPRVRLGYAWPSYVTLHDKAALIGIISLYFVLVGLNDAARESLTASRLGPQSLCGGYPTAPASCGALDLAFRSYRRSESARLSASASETQRAVFEAVRIDLPVTAAQVASLCQVSYLEAEEALNELFAAGALEREEQLDTELAYARAWSKQRARHADEAVRAAYRDALALERSAPALLGLAQQLGEGSADSQALVLEAREVDPALVEATLTPPLPELAARDQALLGRESWWSAWPARTLRALFVPVPGRIDASLLAFERAYDRPLQAQRARNRWFWVVPFALLLMLGALLLPTPRYFEPVAIDAKPSPAVKLAGPLIPGIAQVMTGRPLRGAVFVFVWLFAVDSLARGGHPWNVQLLGLDLYEASAATGTTPEAIMAAVGSWRQWLAGVLGAVYLVHVADLRGLRRRLSVAFEEDVESRVGSPLVVPLDSTLASRGDRSAEVQREEPGPFDDSLGGAS